MKNLQFTIGSDFEIPLHNGVSFISAEGHIEGTKKQPLSIDNGCYQQLDCVMAEFNIPPVTTLEDFKKYIYYCINTTNNKLYDKGLHLEIASSAFYTEDELKTEIASTFGCEPSFDVYCRGEREAPKPHKTMRSAGFHIHFGYIEESGNLNIPLIEEMIRLCDVYLGLASIVYDDDLHRRKLYGKAGDFRFKELNEETNLSLFEYRVLGSNMLYHLDFVWDQIQKVIYCYNNDHFVNPDDYDIIVTSINKQDKLTANKLLQQYETKISKSVVKTS